jgi:gamma-glutamyltranspeptidase
LSDEVGITQAISFDKKTGMFTGVADPRTEGKAAGLAPALKD